MNKVFVLKFPFTFASVKYEQLEMRRPKVRDLRKFSQELEKDQVVAMERAIADLCELQPQVIGEIDLEDYAPMKKAFEDFLNAMAKDSSDY